MFIKLFVYSWNFLGTMEDAHTKTVDEVVNYFNTDPERGLTLDQVKKYQEKYGPNGKLKNN